MAINITIIGGGIAGLYLARGLLKYPHLKVTVYESAPKYLDIGGGLAFHGNAIRALELIDPELQAEYFRRATTTSKMDVEMVTQVLVGDRPEGEVLLAELGKAKGRKTIARCDLLNGMHSLLPEGMIQSGKRLLRLEETSANPKYMLTFKDGTQAVADVVIGCDGVHSVIRKYLLGEHYPAVELKNYDNWKRVVRHNVPTQEVNALNPNLFSRVGIFCGHGSYTVGIPTHFGSILNVTIVQQLNGSKREHGLDKGKIEDTTIATNDISINDYAHWTKDARDLVTLALRDPSNDWKLADHDPAPFYAKGNTCMIGDAAHATMPFNGQGAAQSIEDAACLTAIFEHIKELSQVENALHVFDEVRRPRTQKIVELSRHFGRMYGFIEPGVGDDINKIRAIMGAGAVYANDVDLKAMNEDAVKRFLDS